MIKFHINQSENANYIYQQIYERLKGFILEHKITAGDKLPSKRQLANELGVSINSVATAYDQLLAEGYIYTIERKGYFVETVGHFINVPSLKEYKLPKYLKETSNHKKGWLSFSHIATDSSRFPFNEWMKSQQKAIKEHKREFAEITHPQGPFTVRRAISDMIALTRGVTCEPEQIVIGSGTQPLVHQLMAMQSSNIKIAVENPGYSRIFQLLKTLNLNVLPIELDKEGIDIGELKRTKPDFLFVTPSHQFPTGAIMPISRRVELLSWATMKEDRYIIEDDYDSEFKYGTDNIPSLQSLDQNRRVIYVGTFSKTLLPSFRISYMVLPPKLLEKYKYHYSDWIQGSNSLHLYTLHDFIQRGEYARHIKRMNQHYNKKRKHLINALRLKFQGNIHIKDVPAGLHFLATFNAEKSYEKINEKAQEEKLEIYTIKRFMLEGEVKRSSNIQLVIGFASIKQEDIAEAVDRLYRVVY
ncbi:PLP-dependent aminotransferase family protein [Lentibacillus sp. CBA3610]|uniref:MocR-like transcriptional regulator GabR n=1 Tax=Lentibacillus sp. CBA3610 TaxID=2518176 RepID=UPI0015960EE8|nr:PLP-dependent aminotransferase family protein [Lentibacillus sp. CBA3610]QKY68287.1 PLP-dependent aminotransferase family protein [Lentibacillus sp. CBA3610]